MKALPSDARLTLKISRGGPVSLLGLAIRKGHVPYAIKATCSSSRFDSGTTTLTFSGLLLSDPSPDDSGNPLDTLVGLLRGLARQGPDGAPPTELAADCEIAGYGIPQPNAVFSGIELSLRGDVLFSHDGDVTSHPLTPHLQTNPLERAAVSFRLSQDVLDAIEAYESDETARAWPLHRYIAEYAMQRGAWRDVNFDETLAKHHSEWSGGPDGD